jgi:hypothetical protein
MRLAIRLIEHKSGQTNFDSESFEYFKIGGDLREVSMMKSVPNWIYYSHEFSRIFFPNCLSIFLGRNMEFGFIYLEKFTDEWDPPVSRSVAGCHAPIGWPGRCRARAGIRSVRSLLCSKPTTSLFERRASVRARHRHCPAVLRPSVSKATALTTRSPLCTLQSRLPPLSPSSSPCAGRRRLQS